MFLSNKTFKTLLTHAKLMENAIKKNWTSGDCIGKKKRTAKVMLMFYFKTFLFQLALPD